MTSCTDCPDFDTPEFRAERPEWTPRATCCRDDHIDRRLGGSLDPWEGHAQARKISDRQISKAEGNRKERRAKAAKQRKATK